MIDIDGVINELIRIHAKLLTSGPESLTDEEKKFIQDVAQAMVTALQPLMEALKSLAEEAVRAFNAWWEQIPPEAQQALRGMSATQENAAPASGGKVTQVYDATAQPTAPSRHVINIPGAPAEVIPDYSGGVLGDAVFRRTNRQEN